MKSGSGIVFPPYRLDPVNKQLWSKSGEISLRPKTFAVLQYLVEHAGHFVTKEDLLQAVWTGTYVSDTMPKLSIREIRQALGDDAKAPHFVETVPRRGYRFIAPVQLEYAPPTPLQSPAMPNCPVQPAYCVGREAELAQLQHALGRARQGQRQTVFLSGEVGIGKTTLLETFLAQAVHEPSAWLMHGQCIEQFGIDAAYLPILTALEQWCQVTPREEYFSILYHGAPSWLAQLPSVLDAETVTQLQYKTSGATQERVVREIADGLEALSQERLLILALEDLHWSDRATLHLLSFLAQRHAEAALLIIGTHRPIASRHDLASVQRELMLHGQCESIRVPFLKEPAVATYLQARQLVQADPAVLSQRLHQQTEGNPLFLTTMVDYLVEQDLIESFGQAAASWPAEAHAIPHTLQQMLERQLSQLAQTDQYRLEVASIAGVEFSAAAVAAGLDEDLVSVEAWCEGMARQGHFLTHAGTATWPDGTTASQYRFVHALYQRLLRQSLPAARAAQLNRAIGLRKEAAYADHTPSIAAELAVHFEVGQEWSRAVRYWHATAVRALQRGAHHEAIHALTTGLGLLSHLSEEAERVEAELRLQITLGVPLIATKGYAASEVEQAYTRARTLCSQVGETPELFQVLSGLWEYYGARAELHTAKKTAEQLVQLAERIQTSSLLLEAYHALGITLLYQGEFSPARDYLEQGSALYDAAQHHSLVFTHGGADRGVACLAFTALALWHQGYSDRALSRVEAAVSLARDLDHPLSLAYALNWASTIGLLRRENTISQQLAEEVIDIATRHGFPTWQALGTILLGANQAELGELDTGMMHLEAGLSALKTTGQQLGVPSYQVLLILAYAKAGRHDEGLQLVQAALEQVQQTGEHFPAAGLHALKGVLLWLDPTAAAQVDETFRQALLIARQQKAKALELRAAMGLCVFLLSQGKKREAKRLLAPVYNWFTEGLETPDLQEAQVLLAQLA